MATPKGKGKGKSWRDDPANIYQESEIEFEGEELGGVDPDEFGLLNEGEINQGIAEGWIEPDYSEQKTLGELALGKDELKGDPSLGIQGKQKLIEELGPEGYQKLRDMLIRTSGVEEQYELTGQPAGIEDREFIENKEKYKDMDEVDNALIQTMQQAGKSTPLLTTNPEIGSIRSPEIMKRQLTTMNRIIHMNPNYQISKHASDGLTQIMYLANGIGNDLGGMLLAMKDNYILDKKSVYKNIESSNFINMLIDNGLISNELIPSQKLKLAIAIAITEKLKEAFLKENKNIVMEKSKDPQLQGAKVRKEGQNKRDFLKRYDARKDPARSSRMFSNQFIEKEDLQFGLAEKILDYALQNPYRLKARVKQGKGDVPLPYKMGGASFDIKERYGENVVKVLEGVATSLLYQQGVFQNIEDPNNPRGILAISPEGADLFNATRHGLDVFNIRDITYRSKTPVRMPMLNDIRGAGKRSEFKANTLMKLHEEARKRETEGINILNAIAYRVSPTMFAISSMMVDQVVSYDNTIGPLDTDVKINPETWAIDSNGRQVPWSTHAFAKTVGLDKSIYMKAYRKHLKMHTKSEAEEHAKLVMVQEAKKLVVLRDRLKEALDEGVFYTEWFSVGSVGRFFQKNSDINPQMSKFARMNIRSGINNYFNVPSSGMVNDPNFKAWAYQIGYNLLDGDVPTKNMGWDAIEKPTLQILKEGMKNPIYAGWVAKGYRIMNSISLEKGIDLDYLRNGSKNPDVESGVKGDLAEELFALSRNGNKGEWSYKILAYLDVYNYHWARDPKNPSTFYTQVMIEQDGKTNGPAIQAYQMGDQDILKLVGILYNDENNVVPWGTLRDKFIEKLPVAIDTAFVGDEDKRRYYQEFYDNLLRLETDDPQRYEEVMKLISKTPMTEVGYGKDSGYNYDTATELWAEHDDIMPSDLDIEEQKKQKDANVLDEKLEDINIIIQTGLQMLLDIKTQQALKRLGEVSAMFGGILEVKGPMDIPYYIGGTNIIPQKTKDGKEKSFQLPLGQVGRDGKLDWTQLVDVPIFDRVSSGTNPARISKVILNTATNEWISEPTNMFGKQMENQAPVVSIQQIDAAIMLKMLIDVNRNRMFNTKNPKAPLFVIPIHDAIITDPTSVRQYHLAINRAFHTINLRYNYLHALADAYERLKSQTLKYLADNPKRLDRVDFENDRWRALHRFLITNHRILHETEKEKEERLAVEGYSEKRGGKQFKRNQPSISDNYRRKIDKIAKQSGKWNPDTGGFLTHNEISSILKHISSDVEGYRVGRTVRFIGDTAEANKESARSRLLKRRGYNIN